ncbi:unnamed protein product [Protopolystoma xenopodis]|uniref:Uncharacterized protein n=1 Tax=Protopolystoma xenopodis TaxID=117903 RepID=A0A448WZK8_9PLAT|nr:unnamed protein product [Protopolystoma xenopodis]
MQFKHNIGDIDNSYFLHYFSSWLASFVADSTLPIPGPSILHIHQGLAGCGAMLVHDRENQSSFLYDFGCPAPNSSSTMDDPNLVSSLVGVPGLVAGLKVVHTQFGALAWADLFHAAKRAVLDGFQVC